MRERLRNPYNWFLLVLVLINLLPFLAPIFMELAKTMPAFQYPAKAIYFIYSFTCHQFHHRSLHVYDHQCAWCARDVGIWLGILLIAIVAKYKGIKGIRWYWVTPFVIPMLLDGGIQTLATIFEINPQGIVGDVLYMSSNFSRFMTGAIFGIGISLWISPAFLSSLKPLSDNVRNKKQEASIVAATVLGSMVVIYVLLVGIWAGTSSNYLPSDALDSIVRTPVSDFYIRRENGVCPTTNEELLNIECFFE